MTSVVGPKAYWDLLETVWWIRSRDEEWVADMQDKSEEDKAALALFGLKPEVKLLPRLSLPEEEFNAAMQMVSACAAEPILLDQTLDDLFKKVSSGQVRMTAIRFGGSSDGQIPVPLAELNGLMFRIATGNRVRAGLWSRSHDLLVWSSPQFVRADAMRAYPAGNKKTAATTHAMLRHLRQLMTAEAPLTKLEAQQRCMAEVPHAYPEAFKKAWAELEPSCKRGRGKHGRRAH
jgi:hypothetical protein